MENKKSIGLPGGPNEFLKDITQYISIEGYKRYSKDINNPVNIIESGSITMEDVDFPVMGTDNLGNSQMMMPGNNYQFPGDRVFEVPMAQTGYEVPKRNGVRLNYDDQGKVIGESSHIMKTETDGKGNWFSFPTLFQDEDGTWDTTYEKQIQLNEKNWMPAYKEAQRRGEVIEFGTDKEAAIKFGEGSWKPKMKRGGGLLDKTMECNNCGWSWKAADGGADVSTCHKCGGSALPKAQDGKEATANTFGNMAHNLIDYFTPIDNSNPNRVISNYKPSISKDKAAKYYTYKGLMDDVVNNLTDQKTIDRINSTISNLKQKAPSEKYLVEKIGINSNTKVNPSFESLYNYFKNVRKINKSQQMGSINLGHYKVDAGEDENGKYISIFDTYDWNILDKFKPKGWEIYDRVYEKDFKYGSSVPKAQFGRETYAGETSEDSPISAFLNKTQDNVNDWLGDTMNSKDINKLFDLDLMGQMKILEDEYAKIWDSVNDELGQPENESAINNDPRVNDAWLRMNSFRDANPEVLQYEQAEDPLRHAIASANTSRAIQQKVRDTPYIGSLLDYIGADKAAGFVGSNLAGIGHEAMTILNDDRDWKDKGKESWEDIYNNFQGSLIGAQDISQEEIANKAFELYNAKKLKEGIVYQEGGQPTTQDSLDLYNLSLYKYNQIKNGDVQYKGKTVSAGDIYPSGTFNAIKGDDYAEFADDNLYPFQNKIAPTGEYVAGIKNDPKKLFGITYDTGGLSGSLNYVYPKPKGEVNLEDYENSFLKIKEFEDSKKNKDSKAAGMIKAQLGNGEYKVSSGDTFYGIANKNNVTWDELKKANPNIGYNNLKLNQSIVIPKKINTSPYTSKPAPSKDSNILDYNAISNYLVKNRGGTKDTWGQLADLVAFHESGPAQRWDPRARQISQRSDGSTYDGPGRGVFQFENESFNTALKRYKNIASAKGYSLKNDIVNAKSADELSLQDQYALFLANLIESRAKLSDFADGDISALDVWLTGHKNVEAKGNRNSFLESKNAAEKETVKRGYRTFQEGGEPNLFDMYSGYINGDYDGTEFESKAALTYDKLNRVYYKEAKDAGMNVPNYIMTYVIGNS